jgi:glutamate synthase (NADPH/NADH) large chain
VIFAALLGAEEFGFATAPLVASGCIMMRKCHLNTCPVGVATQDPELRKRFQGKPEHVIRYFFYVAEEARRLMASLGFRTLDEMVGRVECIVPRRPDPAELPPRAYRKTRRIDFAELLYRPKEAATAPLRCVEAQDHNLRGVIDHKIIAEARPALEERERLEIATEIRNRDRAFGAMLSGEIARRFGNQGLPDDTIVIHARGSAGQSFGAWASPGMTLHLIGEANDYVGKGLSGGVLAVAPPGEAPFAPDEQVIVGNTVLYGAISGRAFFNGRAGERFCVRNSGAIAVVEGVGDHGCEYMTGGTVVVLGTTGRNFAAGMSGGVAYVYDEDGLFVRRCNTEMVELETVSGEDAGTVQALVEEHARRTGSQKARALLGDWETVMHKLVKVLPSEYRRVLSEQAKMPETAGRVGDDAPRPYQSWRLVDDGRAVSHG